MAIGAGAKQYGDNNTLQLMRSELVRNVPAPSAQAIRSIATERREAIQGSGISTQANHLATYTGLASNLFSNVPEDIQADHRLQNGECFGFAHEPAAYATANNAISSTDQNRSNSHATTPAEGPYTSYLQLPAVDYSDITTESDWDVSRRIASDHSSTRYNAESPLSPIKKCRKIDGRANENSIMETEIESEIARDKQSTAFRWATKLEMAINQNRKLVEAFAEKPTSLLLELQTMESLSDNDLFVILRLVMAIGSDHELFQFMMILKSRKSCRLNTASAATSSTVDDTSYEDLSHQVAIVMDDLDALADLENLEDVVASQ